MDKNVLLKESVKVSENKINKVVILDAEHLVMGSFQEIIVGRVKVMEIVS